LAAAGVFTSCGPEETQRSSEARDREEVEQQAARPVAEEPGEVVRPVAEETSEEQRCSEEVEEIRIGDSAKPESVPSYEILQEELVERDCARAVRLLVDTRAGSEADYTLIAREIKAEYQNLDAVTVEFTDTMDTLSYNSSALILNTPRGSEFIGYIYHPPNNEGYRVDAARD
jgi:hypothetical protein